MGQIKKLAGETVLYGLGSILPRFLNFLLIGVHTSVFSLAEYGVITKLFAYVAVVNVVFIFGMETAYFRYSNRKEFDEQRVYNVAQTVVMVISLLLSIVFLFMTQPLSEFLLVEGHTRLVVYVILIMFIDASVAIPFARLRYQKKPKLFAYGKLVNIIIFIGLNIYLLQYSPWKASVEFVILANLIANAFFLLFFSKSLLSWRPTIDKQLTPEMVSYSYPVMLTGLIGISNEMFSRITLEYWLPANFYEGKSNASAVGIFGAAYKFAILMNLAIQAFRYAAEPFFFSNASDKKSPKLFATINHYFVIVCCLLLLGVSTNLEFLTILLRKKEFHEGLFIVPILLLAYLFAGLYYNFSVWFKLTNKTYYGTIITIGGFIVTLVGNYLLIPILGYYGSAIAALLCYSLMALACFSLGQKYYPIPYEVRTDLSYIILTCAAVYGINLVQIENDYLSIAFRFAMVLAFVGIVYLIERPRFRKVVA